MEESLHPGQGENDRIERRKLLKTLGIGAISSAMIPAAASEKADRAGSKPSGRFYFTAIELKEDRSLKEKDLVRTFGYHQFNDGGHAEYLIQKNPDTEYGTIALENGLYACLVNVQTVGYKMFGTVSDGKNDDGVQIKAAHNYANKFNLPIVNLSGEYWIKDTNNIPILNNVEWGNSIFHIDEKFNGPASYRFSISERGKETEIVLTPEQKASFLDKLRPGVRVISELAPYTNSLVFVLDKNDQIGFRSGEKYVGQSWAREEFFYVEEHGRIIGDIAWQFKDYTNLLAIPLSNTYLTVNGGGFYLSGDSSGKGYTRNGFTITRSRTLIKNQWVGLEPGKRDTAPNARTGFYSFSKVFDVTLENVRLIPYEQDREGTQNDVPAGTYGISAARMLNGLFRNVTAEGGTVHWGVFGTNLNKNFKVENCRLNRIDVHFHCWNLHIKDSQVGYRGISITGGGDLLVENSSCAGSSFINFRRDFGARWDGDIRLQNCRFIPSSAATNTVLDFNPADFNYRYPIGFGRSIIVENLVIDYKSGSSKAVCWLMRVPAFSRMKHGERLFFPGFVQFRNILVKGGPSGVRIFTLAAPEEYLVEKAGSFDGARLVANSKILIENVDLEDLEREDLSPEGSKHISFGKLGGKADKFSLYPTIKFRDCQGLVADFSGLAADVLFSECSIGKLTGGRQTQMPGKLTFSACSFRAIGKKEDQIGFDLATELGTSFMNCTVHIPCLNGVSKPELLNRIDFMQINKVVQYNHLNTLLGRDVLNYCRSKGITLQPRFISMLKSHHELEAESV